MRVGGNNKEALEALSQIYQMSLDGKCSTCDTTKAGCENSSNGNAATCWADEAYQTCGGSQDAYDEVMRAGGSTPLAYCYAEALKATSCATLTNAKYTSSTSTATNVWVGDTPFIPCTATDGFQTAQFKLAYGT